MAHPFLRRRRTRHVIQTFSALQEMPSKRREAGPEPRLSGWLQRQSTASVLRSEPNDRRDEPNDGRPSADVHRAALPAAGGPDVVVALPAMIAVDPHIASIRRRATPLNNRSRRPDANHDLRERGRSGERKCKQQRECKFLHDKSIPPGLNCRRKRRANRSDNSMNALEEILLRRLIAIRQAVRFCSHELWISIFCSK